MNFRLVTAAGGVRTLASVFEFAQGLLDTLKTRSDLPAEACECVTAAQQAMAALQARTNTFRPETVCSRHYLAMCDALHVQCTQLLGQCCASVAVAECLVARTLSVPWKNVVPLPHSLPAWIDAPCGDACVVNAMDSVDDEDDDDHEDSGLDGDRVDTLDSFDPPDLEQEDVRAVHAFAWAPADFFWAKERTLLAMKNHCYRLRYGGAARQAETMLVEVPFKRTARLPVFAAPRSDHLGKRMETIFRDFCAAQIRIAANHVNWLAWHCGGNAAMVRLRVSPSSASSCRTSLNSVVGLTQCLSACTLHESVRLAKKKRSRSTDDAWSTKRTPAKTLRLMDAPIVLAATDSDDDHVLAAMDSMVLDDDNVIGLSEPCPPAADAPVSEPHSSSCAAQLVSSASVRRRRNESGLPARRRRSNVFVKQDSRRTWNCESRVFARPVHATDEGVHWKAAIGYLKLHPLQWIERSEMERQLHGGGGHAGFRGSVRPPPKLEGTTWRAWDTPEFALDGVVGPCICFQKVEQRCLLLYKP